MKKPKDPSTYIDAELFRQALEGVIPLQPANRATVTQPPKRLLTGANPVSTLIPDTLSDHGAENQLLTEFARNGISHATLRKLRRGQWPIEDSLDLHGLQTEAARRLLREFVRAATEQGLRCVCIIHGKGRHTEGGEGILKSLVRHWLTQCPEVLAFCETPAQEGGGGAVKMLLKNL